MLETPTLTQHAAGRSQICMERYVHTLQMAYCHRGFDRRQLLSTLPPMHLTEGSAEDIVKAVLPGIRQRLSKLGLHKTLLRKPKFRHVDLNSQQLVWPIINSQGAEWYESSPMTSFDFLAEANLGLHDNAKVIYDFGGHHGIWALYYSTVVGKEGRVYSFEPSLINVEVASLVMLVNGVSNVTIAPVAISSQTESQTASNMLVDYVSPDSIETSSIRNCCWDKADFLKMDIEGYEFEILTENPWIFDVATHMHLEVHIPHLQNRGLDYRKIMDVIPFDEFDVFNHSPDHIVHRDSELDGFCGLLLRRKNSLSANS